MSGSRLPPPAGVPPLRTTPHRASSVSAGALFGCSMRINCVTCGESWSATVFAPAVCAFAEGAPMSPARLKAAG